jgi:hypothetical protein
MDRESRFIDETEMDILSAGFYSCSVLIEYHFSKYLAIVILKDSNKRKATFAY